MCTCPALPSAAVPACQSMPWQEAAAAAKAEAQQLRKQNTLLAAEVEGARDAVSQLLDRISGMQVRPLASDCAA
jgi:hypothetical protein